MDSETTRPEETPKASYTVIKYSGQQLPNSYKALVFSKWLRSLRYGNEYFKLIDQSTYFLVYHSYIERLLQREHTVVRLAVVSDDEDTVLGFSVTEPGVLHYVHVHTDQRMQGIATSLCKNFTVFTHITNDGLRAWGKHPEYVFNPFKG